MVHDEQTLCTQLAEARQAKQAATEALRAAHAHVAALEAALASMRSPVPIGAIIVQQRTRFGVPQGQAKRYRVERVLLRGRNERDVQLMGQPLNKDGSDHARHGPTYLYGDYTIVALPEHDLEP